MTQLAIDVEAAAEISCVILPLAGVQLVLPAVCVAEVLPWRAPRPLAEAPPWCLGTLDWHGAVIPVIDHEAIDAVEHASAPGRCVAVINRVRAEAGTPFYALVAQGIPRLVQIAQVDLAAEADPQSPAELLRIQVGTELLVIPDLQALELRIAGLPASGC